MITCPICDRKYQQLTISHISKHGMTMDQFRQTYPLAKLISDEVSDKHKNIMVQLGSSKRNITIDEYNKNPKMCRCGSIIPYDKRNQLTCGHKCANSSPDRKHDEETKTKISQSINSQLLKNGRHSSQKISECKECHKIMIGARGYKFCSKECKKISNSRFGKWLGDTYGKSNLLKCMKRSKPEIKLYELLSQIYKCDHNIEVVNGWDADITIRELNLTIHWNGIWHYQQITKSHSVLATQTRDYIKFKTFQSNNWKSIFIKDHLNSMTPEKAFQRIQECISKNEYDITIL